MMRPGFQSFGGVLVVVFFALSLWACGSSSDSNRYDGDVDSQTDRDDTPDGDKETAPDGDADGQDLEDAAPSDGDADAELDQTETESLDTAEDEESLPGELEQEQQENVEAEAEADAEPESGEDCAGYRITSFGGTIQDEDGEGLTKAMVAACFTRSNGVSGCTNVTTSKSGTFRADVLGEDKCLVKAALRALYFPSGSTPPAPRNMIACPIPLEQDGSVTIAPIVLAAIPESTHDPLGDSTKAHTISTADGPFLTLVPDGVDFAATDPLGYEELHFMAWDDGKHGWPCFIDPKQTPKGLTAFRFDVAVKTEGAAMMSFPNRDALSAGTVVDVYGLGSIGTKLFDGTKVGEGEWAKIGQATVSGDEQWIVTDAPGLPFLSWVGWVKP